MMGTFVEHLLKPAKEIKEHKRRLREVGELSRGTRERVIRSLSWLIEDAKYRHDDCKNNIEEGSEGGYSPELTETIDLLDELRKGVQMPDEDLLTAAYRKGFEDAKKQITEKIQALVKRE